MGNQTSNKETSNNKTDKLKINLNANTLSSSHIVQRSQSDISPSYDTLCSPTKSTLNARLSTPKPVVSPHSASMTLSSYPSTPAFPSRSRRNSSFCNVNNGITGTHISSRISKIAAKFWQKNVENLSVDRQLEVGCAIFFGALSSNKEMKDIMLGNMKNKNKNIEQTSLRYMDMIGWLLRNLITDNIDLFALLTRLGIFHQKMGIKIHHFGPMLQSMHETFSYYFPKTYKIEVKYAMDEIFSLAAQVMSGEDLKHSSHLNDITKTFEKQDNIEFIQNLDICLKSTVGREYLYRYLQQTFCDEIVLFLQTICKFKSKLNGIQRFMIARDIIKTSIKSDATFTLNLSYECRKTTLHAMQELEQKFAFQEDLNIDIDFFDEVELEIYRMIIDNHWKKFVKDIKMLQSKSFGL